MKKMFLKLVLFSLWRLVGEFAFVLLPCKKSWLNDVRHRVILKI